MFDDELLLDYMQNFYGYGNFKGDYWFVGMEEGGGSSFGEVQTRLNAWNERGRKLLEDLRDYHYAIGITQWFDEKAKLQATCKHLIRVLLPENAVKDDILRYQRIKLGRSDSNHAMLELLPLPSRSLKASDWWYNQYSKLPYLANRDNYQNQFLFQRAASLRQRVQEYQPKAVVFYGTSYEQWWHGVAETYLAVDQGNDFAYGTNGKTLFVMMKHPVAHGVTNEYFQQVGQKIRTLISNSP